MISRKYGIAGASVLRNDTEAAVVSARKREALCIKYYVRTRQHVRKRRGDYYGRELAAYDPQSRQLTGPASASVWPS